MKTSLSIVAATMSAVSANFSFGACKTFTDLGMADNTMTGGTAGTFGIDTYIEIFRTSDTGNELMGDCISATHLPSADKVSERVKGWYWYAFFGFVTNDIKTQWDATKSTGYQSLSLMDTDYTQTANIKLLDNSNNKIVTYQCVNTFWGIGKNEYVRYLIKKTDYDTLKTAGTDFTSTMNTYVSNLKTSYPSWEFI